MRDQNRFERYYNLLCQKSVICSLLCLFFAVQIMQEYLTQSYTKPTRNQYSPKMLPFAVIDLLIKDKSHLTIIHSIKKYEKNLIFNFTWKCYILILHQRKKQWGGVLNKKQKSHLIPILSSLMEEIVAWFLHKNAENLSDAPPFKYFL